MIDKESKNFESIFPIINLMNSINLLVDHMVIYLNRIQSTSTIIISKQQQMKNLAYHIHTSCAKTRQLMSPWTVESLSSNSFSRLMNLLENVQNDTCSAFQHFKSIFSATTKNGVTTTEDNQKDWILFCEYLELTSIKTNSICILIHLILNSNCIDVSVVALTQSADRETLFQNNCLEPLSIQNLNLEEFHSPEASDLEEEKKVNFKLYNNPTIQQDLNCYSFAFEEENEEMKTANPYKLNNHIGSQGNFDFNENEVFPRGEDNNENLELNFQSFNLNETKPWMHTIKEDKINDTSAFATDEIGYLEKNLNNNCGLLNNTNVKNYMELHCQDKLMKSEKFHYSYPKNNNNANNNNNNNNIDNNFTTNSKNIPLNINNTVVNQIPDRKKYGEYEKDTRSNFETTNENYWKNGLDHEYLNLMWNEMVLNPYNDNNCNSKNGKNYTWIPIALGKGKGTGSRFKHRSTKKRKRNLGRQLKQVEKRKCNIPVSQQRRRDKKYEEMVKRYKFG